MLLISVPFLPTSQNNIGMCFPGIIDHHDEVSDS